MTELSAKKQAIYLGILFVFFLNAIELSYRVYQYFAYDIPIFTFFSGSSSNQAAAAGSVNVVIGHPLMHYVLNPELPSHTRDLFRVTDEVTTPKRYIVCMGGSSTYGSSVSAQFSYPNRLQHFLNANGKKYKVLNAGVPGWAVVHHLSRYINDLRYRKPKPDLLIMYFGYNDTWLSLSGRRPLPGHGEKLKVFHDEKPLWRNYRILIWLFSRIELLIGKNVVNNHLNDFAFKDNMPVNAIDRKKLIRFGEEFELLLKIAKIDDVNVLVVLQDTNGEFGSDVEKEAFYLIKEEIKRISLENAVNVVDMHSVTRSKKEYFTDVIHMTKLGNEIRAKYIAKVVPNVLGAQ